MGWGGDKKMAENQLHFDVDRDRRLRAFGIDDETRAVLREAVPHLEKVLDASIEASYERMLSFPDVAKVYSAIEVKRALGL